MNSKKNRGLSHLVTIVLLAATLGASSLFATTFISVEPIPTADVVGEDALDALLGAGYSNLALWAGLLLNECGNVQDVIKALRDDGRLTTVTAGNTAVRVGAGGFEGVTNPSYVFTVRDSGPGAVSAADVDVLDNALGYVLSQGGTAHFSPDNKHAYDFKLDFAVVTFEGTLTGEQAKAFFEHLGTIDPALFSGLFAGFTQIDFQGSPTNNSMLFLQPATSKRRFIDGLSSAADSFALARYVTRNNNDRPTTDQAGIAFPGNDWIAFPGGDQYLARLGTLSPQLRAKLNTLRQQHLEAVANLLVAIRAGTVEQYLQSPSTCPGGD